MNNLKPKNKPVGHHEIDLLLKCGHINRELLEAAIFVPLIGETRICQIDGKQTTILRVGTPYWVDEEE